MREPTSNHDAASLLRESTLPHIERAVLTELAWHWPNVWPSAIRIAEHTGLARSTIYPAIERLAKQGIIGVTSTVSKYGKRRVIRYLIHWDKIQQAEPKNTRSTVTRLRQELAKTQQALWETITTKNAENVREADIESVREMDINSESVYGTTQSCPSDGLIMSMGWNVSNKQKKYLKAEEKHSHPAAKADGEEESPRRKRKVKVERKDDANGEEGITPEEIYQQYPRKKQPLAAIKAIEKAVVRLGKGEGGMPPMPEREARDYLSNRTTAYARSPEGSRPDRNFIPYPSSWFNAGRYLEDESEWQSAGDKKGPQREKLDISREAAERAMI